MIRLTSRPAMRPASLVAWRWVSSKYAGTVMTASVTFSLRYASASALSFCRIIALISGGVYVLSLILTTTPSDFGSLSTVYGTSFLLRWTSGSSQRRPMNRLIEKTVFWGLVTAWRFARRPTSRSPDFVNATTDGTVRPPSAEGMTVGSPPSMTATTELVVPRSIPMILPIFVVAPVSPACLSIGGCGRVLVDLWSVDRVVQIAGRGVDCGLDRRAGVLGDGHEGRPDHPVAESIAAPQLLDDLAAGAAGIRDVGDGLVLSGVEVGAWRRLDRRDALAFEQLPKLPVDRGDALDPALVDAALRAMLERQVEIVGQRKHLADEALGREAEHGIALLGCAALEVHELRALPLERREEVVPLAKEIIDVHALLALARSAAAAAVRGGAGRRGTGRRGTGRRGL